MDLAATATRRWVVLGLVGLHLIGAALLFVDVRLPFAFALAVTALVVALERPLWGVGLLIAGRLTSTGANAWVRIGKINIDLFEPSLLLCLAALVGYAVLHRRKLWVATPWRAPLVLFLVMQTLSLGWSSALGEGVQEVLASCILLTTTLVLLAFVRSREALRGVLWGWAATSAAVAIASMLGLLGSSDVPGATFEMAQGNREGGFGQHPNWFAMNLMFIVLVCFAMAFTERRRALKVLAVALGLLIFFAQMRSGSRGGTGALLLGGGLTALFHPGFRRLSFWLLLVGVGVVGTVIVFDIGSTASAYGRVLIAGAALMGKSVRVSNWLACWQMFVDSYGIGIGSGGYAERLSHYDWWLYNSQYTYPHGIFWGMMAQWGVVGVGVYLWFIGVVLAMSRQLVRWTRGTPDQALAWAMIATMFGYWCWSWVEFSYDDKPFWEFLALFTVLWSIKRPAEIG